MKNWPVIVLAILFGILLSSWLYLGYFLVDVKVLPMDIKVMNKVGINADTDGLHFGKNFQGGESMRKVTVTNSLDSQVFVAISLDGEFASWVRVSEPTFSLAPGENRTVYYYAQVPEDADLGEYSGSTRIVIRRSVWRNQ